MLCHRLLLLALAGLAAASEPVVATPFEVRKEAQELLAELARNGGDEAGLIERAQALLAAHGQRLLADKDGARVIADLVAERLTQRGLELRFAEAYGPAAERALALATNEVSLATVARSHPFTPAALTAWRKLADRAWDAGRLGLFLDHAVRAGDVSGTRSERVAAARAMVAARVAGSPPQRLNGLDEMWRLERDGRLAPGSARLPAFARRRVNAQGEGGIIGAPPLAFAAPAGDLCAAADGVRLMVFDLLVGRQVGQVQTLGRDALLGRRQCTPVAVADGFVAAGLLDQTRLTLACVDRLGALRWRVLTPPMGFNPQLSAPVAIDGLVAVAMVKADDGAADLVVQAWHANDGTPAWECLVARLANANPWMVGGEAYLGPSLTAAAGHLVVASNNGLLARVDASGVVGRVWTYPSIYDNQANAFQRPDPVRLGSVVSDGLTAVVTPGDAQAMTLVLPPGGEPIVWRGDGAAGEVAAAADGLALLVGQSTVTALDLGLVKARWSKPVPAGTGDPQAVIGDGRALVATRGGVALYALADGAELDRLNFAKPTGIGAGEGVMLLGAEDHISALGSAGPLVARLEAAAAAAPQDWRPLTALASVASARGETEVAVQRYEAALQRGAPPEYAERAARLLRTRLDLAEAVTMPGLIERLARLGGTDPGLANEVTWWRGRQAELSGDRTTALGLFRSVATGPDRMLELRDRLAVSLRFLGMVAATRLAPVPALPQSSEPLVPAGPQRNWTRPASSGRILASGNIAAGYSDGVLSGLALSDGSERWWRRPARPLLGVQQRGEAPDRGVGLTVFAGTAAAAAGLQTGDVLTRFAETAIFDFAGDLVPAVVRLGVRADFTATVLRGGHELVFSGRLGGELVEPVGINASTVLAWPTLVQGGRPEGLWFAAHDLGDGRELWRHALPPVSQDGTPPAPILTPDDLAICPEGADLVALAVRAGAPGEEPAREVWRLPGLAGLLGLGRLLGGRWLWLPEPERDRTWLVDTRDGRLVAQLPVDGVRMPLISDGEVVVSRGEGGGLSLCDLARARVRWTVAGGNPVAVAGDAVLALDAFERLQVLDRASGAQRRLLGDLGTVHATVMCSGQLVVHHSPGAVGNAIAALDPATGTVRWSFRLPMGLELVALAARGDGCGLVVADRHPGAVGDLTWMAVAADGTITDWARWAPEVEGGRLLALTGGALLSAPGGLHAVVGLPVIAAEPYVLPVCEPTAAALAAAPWLTLPGGGRAVLVRHGEHLVVAATTSTTLRLADRGVGVDAVGWKLDLPAEGLPTASVRGDGNQVWRLVRHERVDVPGIGSALMVELEPPATRLAGRPLAVRLSANDAAGAPWWLAGAWAPLPGVP